MNALLAWFSEIAGLYPFLKFLIVGLAVVIQGETGIVLFVFTLASDELNWIAFFGISLIAIIFYEAGVYWLGRLLRRTALGKTIKKHIKNHEKIEKYLHGNSDHLIALSKFIIYFSLAIVFLSGWTKISFKRFLRLRLIGSVIWLIIMTALIYTLMKLFSYLTGEELVHQVETLIVVIIATLLIVSRIAGKIFEKRILKKP